MFLRRSHTPAPRRAVVTGASGGIGTAFARALPQADLLLTGRNRTALERLADELRGTGTREIRVVPADLVQAADRERLVAAAEDFAPDLLINNAGLGTYGSFLETQPARQEATAQVNMLAPVVLTRALLPGMLERAAAEGRRCGLVNVASTLAFTPVPYGALYAASKAFILSWTEALAAELAGQPIDVLAVCPGPVHTPFFHRAGVPGGAPPGSYGPEQVASRALAGLGRRRVVFTDIPSALLLRSAADLRTALSYSLGWGLGMYRAWMGRTEPEPEPDRSAADQTGHAAAAEPVRPPKGRTVRRQTARRGGGGPAAEDAGS